MNSLNRDRATLTVRLSKIVMVAGLAFWMFLVALGNVTDYGTNWAFVQHTLAMDTIFPDSTLGWRAITDPTLQTIAYLAIIATEALTALAFAVAAIRMTRALRASNADFRRARTVTAAGVTLAFALYGIGFLGVGGEWFAMWQSEQWNGQQPAFRFLVPMLLVGIYVFMDNDGIN